jgi:carbamoyltransferase
VSYYLGIFGGVGTNPSAALLYKKKIIAFAEEERFTRIKNAPLALPINSIFFCLNEAKITIKEVKKISFGWDCPHQFKKCTFIFKKTL